jgi:hypothetical protein
MIPFSTWISWNLLQNYTYFPQIQKGGGGGKFANKGTKWGIMEDEVNDIPIHIPHFSNILLLVNIISRLSSWHTYCK